MRCRRRGGPCILSIQRDASSLGTPLCKKEQVKIATETLSKPPTATGMSPMAISQGPTLFTARRDFLFAFYNQLL